METDKNRMKSEMAIMADYRAQERACCCCIEKNDQYSTFHDMRWYLCNVVSIHHVGDHPIDQTFFPHNFNNFLNVSFSFSSHGAIWTFTFFNFPTIGKSFVPFTRVIASSPNTSFNVSKYCVGDFSNITY